jgi:hypothetical protein
VVIKLMLMESEVLESGRSAKRLTEFLGVLGDSWWIRYLNGFWKLLDEVGTSGSKLATSEIS